MHYYKSILQLIKEKDKNCESLKITNETFINDFNLVEVYVSPNKDCKCPYCNLDTTILYGKNIKVIKDDHYSNVKTLVKFTYHRYLCKTCGKTFSDKIPHLIPKNTIALSMKLNILLELRKDVSFTYIANKYNISLQTVINVFEEYINIKRIPFSDVLCMDEFKNLRSARGKYAFVFYDPNRHIICDILEDRQQNRIDNYLYNVNNDEKKTVKYVITDMNNSYKSIIKRHFPSATHIVDTFHFSRYVQDAFNDVRKRIQNKYSNNRPEYKILKKHWRILSAYHNDLETDDILYNHIQRRKTEVGKILFDALSISNELEEAYIINQNFLYGVRNTKYENAEKWLDGWLSEIRESNIPEFISLIKMFINWKTEILNSFIRFGVNKLHNGYLEGINNHIKVIKRISYGYRRFDHFRNRLMFIINKSEDVIIDMTKKK